MMKKNDPDLKSLIELEFESKSPCITEVKVKVPAAKIDEQLEHTLDFIAPNLPMKGFRHGMAPRSMLKSRYSDLVKDELSKMLSSAAVEKADLKQMKAVAVSYPQELPSVSSGKDYEFTFTVEIEPEFQTPKYKGLDVSVPHEICTDEMVESAVSDMRRRFADFSVADTPTVIGDLIKASLSSDAKDKDEFSSVPRHLLDAPETWIHLSNEKEFLPACNQALLGAVAGQEISFKSDFPADFAEAGLAGKSVSYTVKVLEVQRMKPLESDEELCKHLKVADMDQLRKDIRSRIEGSIRSSEDRALKDMAVSKLLEQTGQFPVPPSMVQTEARMILSSMVERHVRTEKDLQEFKDKLSEHSERANKFAENSVRTFYIAQRIAKEENLSLGEDETRTTVETVARMNKSAKSKNKSEIDPDQLLRGILMERVLDFLCYGPKDGRSSAEQTAPQDASAEPETEKK